MRRSLMTVLALLTAGPLSAADWTIGYEGSDQWAHGFLTVSQPVSRLGEGDLIAWGTASYIRYDVIDGGARRNVSAPGVGAGVLWRWSSRRSLFALGPGYEFRWINREGFERRTEHGLTLRADGHHWFGESLILTANTTYYDAIEWTAARSSLEYALGENSFRIGPEIAYQGNDDISVREIGGILRYPVSDQTSAWVRGGTARTELSDGTRRDDPYFSAGVGYTLRY
ncbi:MAG: hypothetical protein KY459_04860 [Acidobacteria bacterium]|nr:hypothetical protein [Acidobacteriota bacterium]